MPQSKKGPAGSPTAGGPAFLVVAKVRHPHGVHGEVLVEIHTDYPERLKPGRKVFSGSERKLLTIKSKRLHNDGLILGFEGINTPEEAGTYRNKYLSIPTSDSEKLKDGEYYFHDLIGLDVEDENGKILGKLTTIVETGANDVYVVENGKGDELLLPSIPNVILKVDLEAKLIKVHLLDGLLDEGEQDR